MDIVIDLSQLGNNPIGDVWWFFKTIGWTIPVFLFALGMGKYWQSIIRQEYRKKRKYILLAIDIPRNNEQTPKAVENIFNQLAGAQKWPGFLDNWWFGELPESFSLEIISVGGYIQFIIHLEAQFRDLVEAMIYAQYPDAEITEIEDYTKPFKKVTFPHKRYDLWGAELILGKDQAYPIKVYREFEDPSAEVQYKDSMAAILESLTRIGPGEQVWVQIVITPANSDWVKDGEKVIKKITGAPPEAPKGIVAAISNFFSFVIDNIITPPESSPEKKDKPTLTKGQQDILSSVEQKLSKIGFYTRILTLYIAEKPVFNKTVSSAIMGSFKQFNTNNLNSFKKHSNSVGGVVYFKDRRLNKKKNNILKAYISRGHWMEPGTYGYVLNSEELASLYHFPTIAVKTPLIQKTGVKKSEPPISLPIETVPIVQPIENKPASDSQKASPPTNLPV